MIAEGVDAIQTDAGNSQIGVIEAANEAGIYVSGDVSDNSALCPNGFYAYMGIDFGENVYQAIKYFVEDSFPGRRAWLHEHCQRHLLCGSDASGRPG